MSLFFYLFTFSLLPSICAHTEKNVETVKDLVLSQDVKPPPTHRTVCEISREMGTVTLRGQCTRKKFISWPRDNYLWDS